MTQDEVKQWAPRLQAAGGGVSIQSDGLAALGVATGLLLGLLARARGHGGQTMLTTMVSTITHALSETIVTYDGMAAAPTADVDLYGFGARYRLYQTSRGWVFLAAPEEREWEALARAVSPDGGLLADGRFATEASRSASDAALSEVLGAIFRSRPAADWERDLLAVDVGCVAVAEQLVERVLLSDEIGRASGYLADVHHPTFDDHPRLAPLVRFSRSKTVARPGCLLGQHTDAVLGELGYDAVRIRGLRDAGVVA